jgi:hypothetical protein
MRKPKFLPDKSEAYEIIRDEKSRIIELRKFGGRRQTRFYDEIS